MRGKRIIASAMALALALTAASCGQEKKSGGKVTIRVGNWPDDTKPQQVEVYNGYVKKMNELYPDIEVVPDTYQYDVKTFMAKGASNQLPTVYTTWFSEIGKIINSGYTADITKQMNENGYSKSLNPELLSLVSKDSKIYAIPKDSYAQGLFINVNLFTEAGLIDENGLPIYPKTYEEMAQAAKTIKEKTGKAGFIIPATSNMGGWHFMNIAWSYGVKFEEQDADGKWKSTFDTQECVAALQYVKDLKWKYNCVPENILVDKNEMMRMFATDQVAMCFLDPPSGKLVTDYGMNKDNEMVVSMPEGPQGRYSQMGGNVQMVAPNATDEEIDAVFKWMEITGCSPELTEEGKAGIESNIQATLAKNGIVLDQTPFKIWVSDERNNTEKEIRSKYANIDPQKFRNYYDFENVIINPEEAQGAQELYAILDKCIQEVLTNEHADPAQLVKQAASDFQKNCLDKTID